MKVVWMNFIFSNPSYPSQSCWFCRHSRYSEDWDADPEDNSNRSVNSTHTLTYIHTHCSSSHLHARPSSAMKPQFNVLTLGFPSSAANRPVHVQKYIADTDGGNEQLWSRPDIICTLAGASNFYHQEVRLHYWIPTFSLQTLLLDELMYGIHVFSYPTTFPGRGAVAGRPE